MSLGQHFYVFGEMSFWGACYKPLFPKKIENDKKCILIKKNVAYHLMYETLVLWLFSIWSESKPA